MATINIAQPANNGDPMPDPVTGTVGVGFLKQAPAESADGDDPARGPRAKVFVTFVRTDTPSPDVTVPAVVVDDTWAAPSTDVPNGTYSLVATAFVDRDPPATDGRDDIHKP